MFAGEHAAGQRVVSIKPDVVASTQTAADK
jgi:hypothetical protein